MIWRLPWINKISTIYNPVSIIYGASYAVAYQERPLRALRANLVFGTDEKRIRAKNKVGDKKSKIGFGSLLSKILDCERMRFSSVHNRGSARTGRRPRKRKD